MVGVTPIEVKEIVCQAVPYVGMGRVFDFLHAPNEALTAAGVELPTRRQATTTAETQAQSPPRRASSDHPGRPGSTGCTPPPNRTKQHIQHLLTVELLRRPPHPHRPRHPDSRLPMFSMLTAVSLRR